MKRKGFEKKWWLRSLLNRNKDHASKNNGASRNENRHFFGAAAKSTSDNPMSESPTFMGVAADMAAPFLQEMYEFGRKRALMRGTPTGHPDDIEFLKKHAEAVAESVKALPYDPATNLHDGDVEDQIEQLEHELPALQGQLAEAIRELENVEREMAHRSIHPDQPRYPLGAVTFSSVFMSLTMAPAFYDGFFYLIEDDRLGWLASGLTGLAVGAGASYLVLGEYKSTSHSSTVTRGLIASLGMCGGVAVIRLWSCGFTTEGILLASGLFLLEAGILLADEIVASGLRARYLKFMADRENTNRFQELVNAATTKVNRIEDKKKEKTAKLEELRRYREERLSRYGANEALKKLMIAAALDGYQEGLAEVGGKIYDNDYLIYTDFTQRKGGK